MFYQNVLFVAIMSVPLLFGLHRPVSSKAVVTLVGAHIKCSHTTVEHKSKRKDCKICLGKGWYLSGDKIQKIECQYCE